MIFWGKEMKNMKKMTHDGLLLCKLQAELFELSVDNLDCGSLIFIRRFMKSEIVKSFDNESILTTNLQPNDCLDLVNKEYGVSKYGSVKFTKNEMYWMGYIYRYFVYTYELSSNQAYKLIKPKELKALFLPYHTLDPAQAIERIMEAKGMLNDDENLNHQYEIFKQIREKSEYKMSEKSRVL